MDNINDKISDHLEFLGYKLENLDDKGNAILGSHENRSNLFISIVNEAIFISVRYNLGKDVPLDKLLVYLPRINARTMFTKWYCEENEDKIFYLCIDTFIFGYEKQLFGQMLDSIENEIGENMPKLRVFLDL